MSHKATKKQGRIKKTAFQFLSKLKKISFEKLLLILPRIIAGLNRFTISAYG